MGPLEDGERGAIMAVSPLAGQYDRDVDPESAHEILAKRAAEVAAAEEERRRKEAEAEEEVAEGRRWTLPGFGDNEADDYDDRGRKTSSRRAAPRRSGYQRQTVTETVVKTVARTAASQIGRALVRGILGSLKRGL
jgi:hypothetical protein